MYVWTQNAYINKPRREEMSKNYETEKYVWGGEREEVDMSKYKL